MSAPDERSRRFRLIRRKPPELEAVHKRDRDATVLPFGSSLPAPVPRYPDPPIFEAVMSEKWWPAYRQDGTDAGRVHALEAQFTVAFALDELSDVDRAEAQRRAVGSAIVGLVGETS